MRLLGIAGSLRDGSHNRRLLRVAATLLPPGVALDEFEELKSVEPFDEDDEGLDLIGVARLREALAAADGVLFVTPEYNGTIPGVLKNAVDWASRPTVATGALANKPVAVVGGSTGLFGAVWAQADLRKALGLAGARVVGDELPIPMIDEAFAADGSLAEKDLELGLVSVIAALVEAVEDRADRAVAA